MYSINYVVIVNCQSNTSNTITYWKTTVFCRYFFPSISCIYTFVNCGVVSASIKIPCFSVFSPRGSKHGIVILWYMLHIYNSANVIHIQCFCPSRSSICCFVNTSIFGFRVQSTSNTNSYLIYIIRIN